MLRVGVFLKFQVGLLLQIIAEIADLDLDVLYYSNFQRLVNKHFGNWETGH